MKPIISIAVLGFWCSTSPNAYAATVQVTVATTKLSGESWDFAGGAPDVTMCLITAANPVCATERYGVCENQFGCNFFNVVLPNEPFSIWVYDNDVTERDQIGAALCGANGICRVEDGRIQTIFIAMP